jgi:sRNA-binding carbon storage regulator CsrA
MNAKIPMTVPENVKVLIKEEYSKITYEQNSI